MAVPVTIVSGFLGAGKTTLLNRLLAETSERLAVLVNDFASINVDAELIESATAARIALSNGCVCCTLRDDLLAAALELASAEPSFDRIVIETSGIAEPYGVMEAFLTPAAEGRLTVESTVCLVDAVEFPNLDFASGELAIDQAAVSDIVLLNKCDLVTDDRATAVEKTLRGALPAMRISRTSHAQLPMQVLLGAEAERVDRPHDHLEHPDYASVDWRHTGHIAFESFRKVVATVPPTVLRAKGILHFEEHPDERAVFHLVGKRSTLTFEASQENEPVNKLVLIGRSGAFDESALRAQLTSLEVT